MKIYFAGSIRGGRSDQQLYLSIISELVKYGTVLTEHIGNSALTCSGEQEFTDADIFERDMNWVREADIIIAEVTTPSLGVGYELGQALAMGKRVVCLHRELEEGQRLSAMVAGNSQSGIEKYSIIEDVQRILKTRLANADSL